MTPPLLARASAVSGRSPARPVAGGGDCLCRLHGSGWKQLRSPDRGWLPQGPAVGRDLLRSRLRHPRRPHLCGVSAVSRGRCLAPRGARRRINIRLHPTDAAALCRVAHCMAQDSFTAWNKLLPAVLAAAGYRFLQPPVLRHHPRRRHLVLRPGAGLPGDQSRHSRGDGGAAGECWTGHWLRLSQPPDESILRAPAPGAFASSGDACCSR